MIANFWNEGYSKGHVIDSLKRVLANHKSDTAGIMLMGKISREYYRNLNSDSATLYAYEAIRLSEQMDFIKGKILPYLILGNITSDRGDNTNGLMYYNNAKEIAESINDYPDLAGAYNNIGIIFYNQGNYSLANDYYSEGITNSLRNSISRKKCSLPILT